jgi:hypothetical protein
MTQEIAVDRANVEGRGADGRWLPGYGGRPKGSGNKTSRKLLKDVHSLADDAFEQLSSKVKAGEWSAIKLVLDYTLPRNGRTIDLDGTADPNSLIEAATSGDISPDEFVRLAQGWKTVTDAADVKELKYQVEQLELLITAVTKK